ncbi:MAG: fibronectin type III domain-containing protein, partial [Candidatus Eisenbacteria bacterium]
MAPGHTYDIYQNSQPIQTGRGSSAGGSLVFASTGGGSFQVVGTGGSVDVTPPAAVTNLSVTATSTSSASLRWNTTGDDGNSGTASLFDVRYATFPITNTTWGLASQATGEPNPGAPGSVQTFTVTGLSAGTTYYFAVKVGDEVPNWSELSNVPSGTTTGGGDVVPPAQVTTLAVSSTATSSVTLTWTAVGDDGTTGRATTYDMRYSTSPIDALNWNLAQQFVGEPNPATAGTPESFVGTGLTPNTTYYFALRVADEASNWSPISNVPNGTTQSGTDSTPPAKVTTLAVSSTTSSTANLSWIAVGDDGATGRATAYDIRYSTAPITTGTWAQAQQLSGEPAPQTAGAQESFVASGLSGNTTYWFALQVLDEAGNASPVSNSPSGRTQDAPDGSGFPLAGFGSETPGGAGGSSYVVTSLANSGPGTLRDAVSASNRMITFAVGGTIQLQTSLDIPSHHLTIDGATAPAPGITIAPASGMAGDLVRIQSANSHDIILRHLRFRDGPGDNVRVDGSGAHHIVFDHCSFRRPGDGNLDITNGAHDLTLQWCILAEAIENSLTRSAVTNVTYHHNFFTHGTRKNPRIRDGASSTDVVNNLVFDWGADYGADFASGGSG